MRQNGEKKCPEPCGGKKKRRRVVRRVETKTRGERLKKNRLHINHGGKKKRGPSRDQKGIKGDMTAWTTRVMRFRTNIGGLP